jgi:hypothetical protein
MAIHNYLRDSGKSLIQYKLDACVIHYRLGDFITLGQCIDPISIIDACISLPIKPTIFYILDGGSTHGGNTNLDPTQSLDLVKKLSDLLSSKFPDSRVVVAPKGSTDDDFFQITAASNLVTTGGSFGILGALSSYATSIRTPACKNTNFPQQGKQNPRKITAGDCPDWRLYDYEMLV